MVQLTTIEIYIIRVNILIIYSRMGVREGGNIPTSTYIVLS